MYDSNQQIIFTSSEPSLAVIYDTKTGLHSVYKIRKASVEECQVVCGNNDTTTSIFNQSASASPLNIGNNLSYKSTNKGHLSIFGKNYMISYLIQKNNNFYLIIYLHFRSSKSPI